VGGRSTRSLECMGHPEFIAVQWKSLADTLEAFQSGRLGVTEASRKVVAIRDALGELSNPLFIPFIAVESETDAFPLGEVRSRWSVQALSRMDAERESAEAFYRPQLIEACGPLMSYSNAHAL
jgi:hypothetical protein